MALILLVHHSYSGQDIATEFGHDEPVTLRRRPDNPEDWVVTNLDLDSGAVNMSPGLLQLWRARRDAWRARQPSSAERTGIRV